jgi:hypothetical protein
MPPGGQLTSLVPELGAPKHLDRDRALQRLRALLTSQNSAATATAAPPPPSAATAAPPTTTATRLATTHDEHTPASITTPVERPRLTTCTYTDRDELAAFEAAVEGPDLLGCSPAPGEEASGRGGSPGWERRLGGLCAARALVEARGAASDAFEERLLKRALDVLEDGEVRVRQAAGGCLAVLAAARGVTVLDAALEPLLASIARNFERGADDDDGVEGDEEREEGVRQQQGGTRAEKQAAIPEGEEEEEGGDERANGPTTTNTATTDPPNLLSSLLASTYKPLVPGTGEMRHGTEGWKALETSVRALQQVVDALPPADVAPRLSADVRSALYGSLSHPNRFVRETGHFMLASVSAALKGPALEEAAPELAPRIADGLSDNWSQVRYAACVAARAFMAALGGLDGGVLTACGVVVGGEGEGKGKGSSSSTEALAQVVPVLLPPMCLNRYYVAAGVRLYAQASWRLLVGAPLEAADGNAAAAAEQQEQRAMSAGRAAVAHFCPAVVAYYVSQSKANNHAVREAACACMAELMEKVERSAVAPHVPALLAALRTCFRDSSWPVRDAACTALGRCVLAYPLETRQSVLGELYGLWAAHLWDNIPTVRENSAAALGRALRAYGTGGEVVAAGAAGAAGAAATDDNSTQGSGGASRCAQLLRDLLPRAFEQPEESARYSGLENVTTFGVAARKARDNDPAVHTGQDMFSCGSLTARFGFSTSRLVRSDGCMDHGFSRGKQPWEASDGGVHLLREYCLWWGEREQGGGGGGGGGGESGGNGNGGNGYPSAAAPADPVEFLPVLLRLARLDTFQHAANLRETVWRCLPDVARGVGARRFKAPLMGGGGGQNGAAATINDNDNDPPPADEGGWLALFAQAAADDLRCGHQLAAAAAGRALGALRDAFGARILASRLRTEEARLALERDPNVPPPAPRTPATTGSLGGPTSAASSLLFKNNEALQLPTRRPGAPQPPPQAR